MKILITGGAGFIGYHLSQKLLERGDEVVGLDSINDYYDVTVKYGRLRECGISESDIQYGHLTESSKISGYSFIRGQLEDTDLISRLFKEHQFDAVCNFAAQGGVRYSITNPRAYVEANIIGFFHLLEACRNFAVQNLVFASSSSVYGLNRKMPFSIHDNVDHPISLYAASKKSNELMAHTYSHLFRIPVTGLRFFTVYGPWGRPDMALFLFIKAMLEKKPIDVFNHGKMKRDFTYIDDIIEGVVRVIDRPAKINTEWNPEKPDPASSSAPYRIYNIGSSRSVELMDYIQALEEAMGVSAIKNMLPMQPGDVETTWADVSDLERDFGPLQKTDLKKGIRKTVEWYKTFYNA